MLKEVRKRLKKYLKHIEHQNPNVKEKDKLSCLLIDYLTDINDMECLNLFAKEILKTAQKKQNGYMIDFALSMKNWTAREIALDDQKRKEE